MNSSYDSPARGANQRLVGQLDAVRRQARLRARRVQRPLLVGGLIVSAGGVVASISSGWLTLGLPAMVLGPWIVLLSVMPTDDQGVLIALGTIITMLSVTLAFLSIDWGICGVETHCALYRVAERYGVTVACFGLSYASFLALASLGNRAHDRCGSCWLPRRPPRSVLLGIWRSDLLVARPPHAFSCASSSLPASARVSLTRWPAHVRPGPARARAGALAACSSRVASPLSSMA